MQQVSPHPPSIPLKNSRKTGMPECRNARNPESSTQGQSYLNFEEMIVSLSQTAFCPITNSREVKAHQVSVHPGKRFLPQMDG